MTRKRSLSDASTSSNNITVQQKLQKIILCTLTNNITKKTTNTVKQSNKLMPSTIVKILMQKQRALMELPFQPSEVAMFSSQKVAEASSGSSEPDVETWVRVPTPSEQTRQEMERISCLPLTTVCWLKIPLYCHQLPPVQHVGTVKDLNMTKQYKYTASVNR